MTTWIDTIEARRALAAEPKSEEELRPVPAVQTATGPANVDVAALVAREVSTQMEGFIGRLEGLFASNTGPVTPAPAPDSPAAPAPAAVTVTGSPGPEEVPSAAKSAPAAPPATDVPSAASTAPEGSQPA